MAAGLGFKTFTTGEVLTAADTNGYLMQGVLVFASSAARASAVTSPQEGQYSFLKDTDSTEYYDGAAWVAAPIGDITGVTAGTGISGGGTSGTVTVTNSMATEITAKGDLIVGTGSATFDNLTAGADGETLVADSAEATGLKWATPAAGGAFATNGTINGGMDIWQRGTSFTALGKTFTADRWWKFRGGDAAGGTWSRQNSAVSAPGTQYCQRIQRDNANTSTATMQLYSDFETSNSIIYADQAIAVSFYARKGANYSGGDFNLTLQTGTGTDQSQFAGFTGETTVLTVTASAASMNTSTFVRYSGTVTLASTVTQIGLKAIWTPTGTAGAADYVEITGVQVEKGASATTFNRSSGTIQGELAACQRYYQRITSTGYGFMAQGQGYGTTGVGYTFFPKSIFRIQPTAMEFATVMSNNIGVAAFNVTSFTLSTSQSTTAAVNFDAAHASGITAGGFYTLSAQAAGGYIALTAEL